MTKWQLSESGIVSCLGLMPRFALWDVPSRKSLKGVWVPRSSGVRDRSYCSRRPLAGWRGTGFSAIQPQRERAPPGGHLVGFRRLLAVRRSRNDRCQHHLCLYLFSLAIIHPQIHFVLLNVQRAIGSPNSYRLDSTTTTVTCS